MKKLTGFIILFFLLAYQSIYSQTHIPAGNASGIWGQSGSLYIIDGNIVVPNNQTLTIELGVNVYFSGDYYLKVEGSLKAIGLENDSIKFSESDTTGYSINEHIGWGSIWISNSDTSNDSTILQHCIINYTKDAPGITVYDSHEVRISNSRISNISYGAAIHCKKATVVIDSNFISNTRVVGILFDDSDGVIRGNRIMYNSGGGIFCGQGDVSISYNLISWNEAMNSAGGITLGNYNKIRIFNNVVSYNTVVGNESQNSAGGFLRYGLDAVVTNCVFWNNIGGEINEPDSFSPNLKVQYCAVEGGYQGPGIINLNSDNENTEGPGFIGAPLNNFSISDSSILANSGATSAEHYYGNDSLSKINISGVNRWLDGAPSIGAYENEIDGSLLTISGTIYDLDGITPLEGIWINGTYSDHNGEYKLNVGEGVNLTLVPYSSSLVFFPKTITDIRADLDSFNFTVEGEYVSCEITEPTTWTVTGYCYKMQ